jgi:RNA polymerase sigma-70 factor (ECF subfamily)
MLAAPRDNADSGLPDAEIARRIGAGDTGALAVLMRRYNQKLFRTARSILKDDAEAEDAVQETYLHAYRGMEGFRGEARISTWLVRVVANEALGRLRKRVRSAEVIRMDGNWEQDSDATEESMVDAAPEQPDQAAMRAQSRRLLEKAIDALPDGFRTVFVLRAVEEMSVEETAEALGISQATVRSRFFRARGLLREALAREADMACEQAFAFAGERCDRIVAGVLARIGEMQAGEA